jgi:hypothetical protein
MAIFGNQALTGGWAGGGEKSLVLCANLTGFYYSLGGGVYSRWGPQFDNNVSYSNVFDKFRVKNLTVEIYYSANSFSNSATVGCPNLYCATDETDGNAINSIGHILTYDGLQFMQLGNMPMAPGTPLCRLVQRRPHVQLNGDNVIAGTSTNAVLSDPNGWYSAASGSGLEFGYFKLWLDPLYSNTTSIGIVTMIVSGDFEFANVV